MTIYENLDNYINRLNEATILAEAGAAHQQASICPRCGSKNVKLVNTVKEGNPSNYFGDDVKGEEYTTEYHYLCRDCDCEYADIHVELIGTIISHTAQNKINKFIYDHWDDFEISNNLVHIPYDNFDYDGQTAFECWTLRFKNKGQLSKDATLDEQKKMFLDEYENLIKICRSDAIKTVNDFAAIYDPKTYKYAYKTDPNTFVTQAKALNIDKESFERGVKFIWETRKNWALDQTFDPVTKQEVAALYDKYPLPF